MGNMGGKFSFWDQRRFLFSYLPDIREGWSNYVSGFYFLAAVLGLFCVVSMFYLTACFIAFNNGDIDNDERLNYDITIAGIVIGSIIAISSAIILVFSMYNIKRYNSWINSEVKFDHQNLKQKDIYDKLILRYVEVNKDINIETDRAKYDTKSDKNGYVIEKKPVLFDIVPSLWEYGNHIYTPSSSMNYGLTVAIFLTFVVYGLILVSIPTMRLKCLYYGNESDKGVCENVRRDSSVTTFIPVIDKNRREKLPSFIDYPYGIPAGLKLDM